jgi:hypothetical protein
VTRTAANDPAPRAASAETRGAIRRGSIGTLAGGAQARARRNDQESHNSFGGRTFRPYAWAPFGSRSGRAERPVRARKGPRRGTILSVSPDRDGGLSGILHPKHIHARKGARVADFEFVPFVEIARRRGVGKLVLELLADLRADIETKKR